MSLTDQITRANARSRRVPSIVFRVLVAWLLSAIVLAILVPLLHARGVSLQPWMPWVVIGGSLTLCVGPDLVRRRQARR